MIGYFGDDLTPAEEQDVRAKAALTFQLYQNNLNPAGVDVAPLLPGLDPDLVADVGDIFSTQQKVAKQAAASTSTWWKWGLAAAAGLGALYFLGGKR